jgi:hypothetical protein
LNQSRQPNEADLYLQFKLETTKQNDDLKISTPEIRRVFENARKYPSDRADTKPENVTIDFRIAPDDASGNDVVDFSISPLEGKVAPEYVVTMERERFVELVEELSGLMKTWDEKKATEHLNQLIEKQEFENWKKQRSAEQP